MDVSFDFSNGTKWLVSVNILALVTGMATIIWFAAQMDSSVDSLEDWKRDTSTRLETMERVQREQGELIIQLDERQFNLIDDVEELRNYHGVGPGGGSDD